MNNSLGYIYNPLTKRETYTSHQRFCKLSATVCKLTDTKKTAETMIKSWFPL